MSEMIGYIIGETKFEIEKLRKLYNKQISFNRKAVLFALLLGAYIHVTDQHISKLTKEIEELKQTERD